MLFQIFLRTDISYTWVYSFFIIKSDESIHSILTFLNIIKIEPLADHFFYNAMIRFYMCILLWSSWFTELLVNSFTLKVFLNRSGFKLWPVIISDVEGRWSVQRIARAVRLCKNLPFLLFSNFLNRRLFRILKENYTLFLCHIFIAIIAINFLHFH